eukprot:s3302_g9.t1
MEDLPATDPRVLPPSKAVPVWYVPEQGQTQDDLLAFFEMQQLGGELNQLVLTVKAGPGDSRMPPLTSVVDQWIPWDETITEEISIHWLVPDATLFATMCDHIAHDAIDLRPDGTDPRDSEQVKLYIHHLPVTDLTFGFSQLHREVRLLRDQQARDRHQLSVLVEWAAASDQTLAGPLGLLLRPEDVE